MQKEPLDYSQPRPDGNDYWDALAGFALLAPFLTVPLFIAGTVMLQEVLVIRYGPSWQRAALVAGFPTGLVAAIALAGGIRAVMRSSSHRGLAITGTVLNSVSLGIIVYGILAA